MVPAAPGVVRRDGSLAERDIVRFRHVDIEVQLCRQIKRFPGLTRQNEPRAVQHDRSGRWARRLHLEVSRLWPTNLLPFV